MRRTPFMYLGYFLLAGQLSWLVFSSNVFWQRTLLKEGQKSKE
jgi:hypothetical protein